MKLLACTFSAGILLAWLHPLALAEPPAHAGTSLSLSEAVSLTLAHNPTLAARAGMVEVAKGGASQARLRPNPDLFLDVENLGGDLAGLRQSEISVGVEFPFERGGKWSSRVREAEADLELASWDRKASRLELMAAARRRFTETLGAQEHLRISEESLGLARKALESVKAQVAAGSVPPVEETRAEVEHASVQMDRSRAEAALRASRDRLAALWGEDRATFGLVEGELGKWADAPSLESLLPGLDDNPLLRRFDTEEARRRAALRGALAERTPDINGIMAFRRLEEIDSETFLVGVSIPLQTRNRNQGNITAARKLLLNLGAERSAQRMQLVATLARAHGELVSATQALRNLEDKVLPGAEEALRLIEEGYKRGKFGFLDFLDSQRTLVQARETHLETLVDYQLALGEVAHLVARPLARELGGTSESQTEDEQ